MQKQMSYKKIIICICAAVAVAAVAVIVLLANREETFRSILVYDVEGNAVIERESVGSMNAAENLYLESGDRVSVARESSMRMKLDDDKYVMAEADTIFSVEAEGSDENSKTRICLEQGAITNEIQHPLSEGSQYETSTPNSVMAVRGTIYRVELYVDDNGDMNTKLCCFQGKVETTPILSDGTYGEAVLVPAGSELTVYGDGTVDDLRDITYEDLPEQALQNVRSLLESGQSMTGITLEELDELNAQTADISEEGEKDVQEKTALSDTAGRPRKSDADAETSTRTAKNASGQKGGSVQDSTQRSGDLKNSVMPRTTEDQPGRIPEAADNTNILPKTPVKVNEVTAGSDNSGEQNYQSGDSDGDSGNNNGSNDEKKDNSNKNNSNKDSSNKDNNDNKDNNNEDDDKPVVPSPTETYTVTFAYQGTVFATQEVKSGETVSAPLLIPDTSGDWDFDFGTGIEADTTIQWKK